MKWLALHYITLHCIAQTAGAYDGERPYDCIVHEAYHYDESKACDYLLRI